MIQPDFEIFITLYIFSHSPMNLQIFRFIVSKLVLLKHKVDINMIVHTPKPLVLKNDYMALT